MCAVDVSDTVVLGKIGAPYGIKGWVKINSYTNQESNIFDYSPWKLDCGGEVKDVTVLEWRHHNKGLIAKLAEVSDRNAAELVKGTIIIVEAEQLPELPENEFYWRDLEGMSVVSEQGYNMGLVNNLMETGSNDVMVVKANTGDAFGKKERLIPFLEQQVIKHIDAEKRLITVDWDPSF